MGQNAASDLKGLFVLLPALAVVGLWGCSREAPKGEVLARADGREITVRDVEAERRAQGANVPSAVLVKQLVQRAILDNAAQARHLDQSPGFPADMRRLRNELLAKEELGVLGRYHLTPKEMTSRLDEADHALSARSFYVVRQLLVTPAELAPPLAHAASPAAAEAMLGDQKLWLETVQALESLSLPPQSRARLDAALASHSPILARQGDQGVLMWVESRQPASMSPPAQRRLAGQFAAQAASNQAEAAGAHDLQSAAKVTYQPGVINDAHAPKPSPAHKAG